MILFNNLARLSKLVEVIPSGKPSRLQSPQHIPLPTSLHFIRSIYWLAAGPYMWISPCVSLNLFDFESPADAKTNEEAPLDGFSFSDDKTKIVKS